MQQHCKQRLPAGVQAPIMSQAYLVSDQVRTWPVLKRILPSRVFVVVYEPHIFVVVHIVEGSNKSIAHVLHAQTAHGNNQVVGCRC